MSQGVGEASCPVPQRRYDTVVLAHGAGGELSDQLLRDVFVPELYQTPDAPLEDAAAIPVAGDPSRLVVTTDSFVVSPLFFPGGDIGSLAIHGTLNDLATAGARPLAITTAFILEEGFEIQCLLRVVRSMRRAADEAGVRIVGGDTKVVDRGKGDQVFINTTGVGQRPAQRELSVARAEPGDVIVLSGTLGDHGATILALRHELDPAPGLKSDSAAVLPLAERALTASAGLRCMRDPTRGGLAATLTEICRASGVDVELSEAALPIRDEVRGVTELFGVDPLYLANEGKLVFVVPEREVVTLLDTLHQHPLGRDAAVVGRCVAPLEARGGPGRLLLRTQVGGLRHITLPLGGLVPRIC